MATEQNLIPFYKRSESEQRELRSQGGINSGKSRKRMAGLRKIVQGIMNKTYTDDEYGELTGTEKLAVTLYKIATDPNDKNCLSAMRLLIELCGENVSPDEKKKLKAEIDLLKARKDKLDGDVW